MVGNDLLRDVTVNIATGILIFSFGRWVGATIAGAINGFGIVVFALFYISSLLIGVYFIVRGLGELVEDIVRDEITHRG
ncbi:hypothetical protein [Haladaptatus caseinilyticus]|uniref:hypothetical protein n=1 Tax=Haladaptatus caseinilyticus TaxID=2993314 RepID=UPI00224A628D|nr:hypothetical protein [Haladaptatus caseinilyticus]